MTDDIVAAIDGAIHDWETSDDAMRWVPEDARTEDARPVDGLGEMLCRVWESSIMTLPERGQQVRVTGLPGGQEINFVIGEVRIGPDGGVTVYPEGEPG